jgi:hypothetical protein
MPTASNVVWASSCGATAGVQDGLVTAYTAGTTVITATAGSVNASCTVAVVGLDFCMDVEGGRDIRVLQLSDMQIIDSSQMRTSDRLNAEGVAVWAPAKMYENCFKYIEQSIKRTNPDLIVITGDIVYGEFDDAGTTLTAIIDYMDSFEIPWAALWGNHDNESAKGVEWQCQQLIDSEYCLFKRGALTGNSNYTIGIRQNGALARVVYLLDSNGCCNTTDESVKKAVGFGTDQITWMNGVGTSVKTFMGRAVPSLAFWHIATTDFNTALSKYGAPTPPSPPFTIGETIIAQDGDFGCMSEGFKNPFEVNGLCDVLKNCGIDGVFVGHNHLINTSILYGGIRWTFGLKTGIYDRYTERQLGGTSILLPESGNPPAVAYVYWNSRLKRCFSFAL